MPNEFVIKNGTNLKVNYNLNFQEKNDYQLNMKYRLKKNGHILWEVIYQKKNLIGLPTETKSTKYFG